jgi:hypothetical protein
LVDDEHVGIGHVGARAETDPGEFHRGVDLEPDGPRAGAGGGLWDDGGVTDVVAAVYGGCEAGCIAVGGGGGVTTRIMIWDCGNPCGV